MFETKFLGLKKQVRRIARGSLHYIKIIKQIHKPMIFIAFLLLEVESLTFIIYVQSLGETTQIAGKFTFMNV